jgi:Undecaprenyl-phosphate galactose phosphotransferase WbaP
MTPRARREIRRKVLSFLALMAGDLVTLLACFSLAYVVRVHVLSHWAGFSRTLPPFDRFLGQSYFLAAVILLPVFFLEKLYARRASFWEECRHLFRGLALTFIVLVILVFIEQSYTLHSRPVFFTAWLFSLALFPPSRAAMKTLLTRAHLWDKKVLILGTGRQAKQVALSLRENPTLGYKLAGFISESAADAGRELMPGARILGPLSRLETICRAAEVQDLILALPHPGPEKFNRIMERCERLSETVRVVPDFGGLSMIGLEGDSWGRVLSLAVPRNLFKPWNILLKESVEILTTIALVVLLLPLLGLVSLAIKLDSRGPVFFRQERLGRHGRTFSILKFRSMRVNHGQLLRKMLEEDPEARADWARYHKIRRPDARVTRVGRWLRKHSLDELPQLLNVLRGQMSLIGPRPYLLRERSRMGRSREVIFQVKPGLTGLWQVRGRSRLTFRERLAWDEYYIRNWTLWLDIMVFFRTLRVVFRGEGAY